MLHFRKIPLLIFLKKMITTLTKHRITTIFNIFIFSYLPRVDSIQRAVLCLESFDSIRRRYFSKGSLR